MLKIPPNDTLPPPPAVVAGSLVADPKMFAHALRSAVDHGLMTRKKALRLALERLESI